MMIVRYCAVPLEVVRVYLLFFEKQAGKRSAIWLFRPGAKHREICQPTMPCHRIPKQYVSCCANLQDASNAKG